jgi:hypothetical protein
MKRRDLLPLAGSILVAAPGVLSQPVRIANAQFEELLTRLADAWTRQETEEALAVFTDDAVYMEPPDIQLYLGREQLEPYFAALKPGTFMRFHRIWFDKVSQTGAGEYSFGREGAAEADRGVAVVELRSGLIAHWREYQRKGPGLFSEFLAIEGKNWRWTIRNYP